MFSRKILTLSLAFYLMSNIPSFASSFVDVPDDYWAAEPIINLSQNKFISGYDDETFKPESHVTRAEFTTMLVKVLNLKPTNNTATLNFNDISTSFWAYKNIQAAYDYGLIKGFQHNDFKPYSKITKVEALAIMAKAIKTDKILTPQEVNKLLSRYYDANKIPDWAMALVAKDVEANIVVNYPFPNFLLPQKPITRAETVAMLYQLQIILNKKI